MSELHHAVREAKPLRIALGLDEARCRERLQQAIQRRPTEADATLDLDNAQRRLVRGEALQDRDGAIDGADRGALAFRARVVAIHEGPPSSTFRTLDQRPVR